MIYIFILKYLYKVIYISTSSALKKTDTLRYHKNFRKFLKFPSKNAKNPSKFLNKSPKNFFGNNFLLTFQANFFSLKKFFSCFSRNFQDF